MNYPPEIEKVVKFLRHHKNLPIKTGGTARQNSLGTEAAIIELMEEQADLQVEGADTNTEDQNNTSWFDFKVGNLFCNLKTSALNEDADNTSAKQAIYYVLTGKNPKKISKHESSFFQDMHDNLKESDTDYYYIIIGKTEPIGSQKRAFAISLRTLPSGSVRTNGRNLPFQCVWRDCVGTGEVRTYKQAYDFLLSKYSESIKKAIFALESGMPPHFPEFFKD